MCHSSRSSGCPPTCFTRSVDGRQIPYIVAGSDGFSATGPRAGLPPAPVTVGEYTLEIAPIVAFGYLTVTVDMSGSEPTLGIVFTSTEGARPNMTA
jgi:hypothetical protein